ncbi:hypothetical protein OSCT_1105 [Oscillochloris trichoides DG-6]|uniref:Ferric oxidoreductase domain-containing protein n=1 Tax=Oscillochloris trichoides DG-6 TaxID=765420 RepID=E1ICQ4_9CHLR|nr:hypothetical protein [Oscillochloris trichoides]EFO81002.1 hypothetical protein OSCT_1105 [Oscillochloris trichoides DG-6]
MTEEKAARLAAIRAAKAAAKTEAAVTDTTQLIPPAAPQRVRSKQAVEPMVDEDLLAMSFPTLLLMLLAVGAGALGAVVLVPLWLPGLTASLLSAEPKAYWYLARSSAFVSYGLLWLAMIFGLLMTSRAARLWPGGPVAFDLHQHASLLGLAFALFHALILLGDAYIQADLRQVLVPFAYTGYQPLWVGLGQVGFYLMLIVSLSFYLKGMLGRTAWRVIHTLSFAMFVLALAHGVLSGSDSDTLWAQQIYWGTGGSVLFLTLYRVLMVQRKNVIASPAS